MRQRVLHLIGSNCIGGPEKQILHHAVSMQDSPYQIEIGSFHDGPTPPEILSGAEERNIPTFCLSGGLRLSLIAELAAVLRERPGALICTHGFKANVVGYFAARRTHSHHVAFLRGWTAETMRVMLYEVMERYVLSRASNVVCVSRRQAEQVARMRKGRSQPIVVPNAMLPPWSRPLAQDAQPVTRAALGIPANTFVFGSVGRLSAEKGHRYMLDAFNRIHTAMGRQRNLHLILVGDGREQPALERQAREYGISNKVYFAGFQGNPALWLSLFDCMVQPSLTEGTPNSVLEAMCLNVPVIATAVGGVPDLIIDTENGLLVLPQNPDSLAASMTRLVTDPALCTRLAHGAQQTNRIYSPAVQKEKLLAVYRQAIAT
jgi:glycosyltransferase involved in cell wall biosynthesis